MADSMSQDDLQELLDRVWHQERSPEGALEEITEEMDALEPKWLHEGLDDCGIARTDDQGQAYGLWSRILMLKVGEGQPRHTASENDLWQVLEACTDVLERRAAPHVWVSQAWNAGREVIMRHRNNQQASSDWTPCSERFPVAGDADFQDFVFFDDGQQIRYVHIWEVREQQHKRNPQGKYWRGSGLSRPSHLGANESRDPGGK